jgi:hypothetical protein
VDRVPKYLQDKPYWGCDLWFYRLSGSEPEQRIRINIPTSNRREDEGMARYLVRKLLGIKRLPSGVVFYPHSDK